MRLLRLHDEAPDGVRLELHPKMSVVTGLHGPARARVLDALAALPGGRGVDGLDDMTGTIESTGILLELDKATLALLDLTSDLDPIVRADDLDHLGDGPLGAGTVEGPAPVSLEAARQTQRNLTATVNVLRQSVEELHESHRRVLARRSVLASALTALGANPRPSATPVPSAGQASDGHRSVGHEHGPTSGRAATTVVLDGPGPSPETEAAIASAAARVDRLRTHRDETIAALEPLADIDTTAVEAAVAEQRGLDTPERRPDSAAVGLADELATAAVSLDAYDTALEAAGLGPVAAYRRLDEAQRWFLAADAAVRPPVIDPEDARALETAHDEVQSAELKLTASRMGGKNVKLRLDEAVVVEQQILARMGFATYTSFVMSTSVPMVSPELRAQHEQAQAAFLAAEAAFLEAGDALERDPDRIALTTAVERARERARAVVGPVADPELDPALRALTVADEAQIARSDVADDHLRLAMQEAGVDFGDLDLAPDEVAEVAEVWLADMAEATAQRAQLTAALADIEREVAAAEVELGDIDTSAPSVVEMLDEVGEWDDGGDGWTSLGTALPAGSDDEGLMPSDDPEPLDDGTRADLEAALGEVDAEAAGLEEQIDAQGALVAATAAGLEAVQAQVAALAAASPRAGAGGGLGGDLAEVLANADLGEPPDESGLAQREWYLLARLAAQRSVSYAGSVPLVLDDPLVRLAEDEVTYLMDRLLRMTEAVQVVYVGDDRRVVEWADTAGADVGLVAVG